VDRSEPETGASIRGKVALITGAAGVIGRATAALLARRGARVIAVDRPSSDRTLLRAALPKDCDPLFLSADVTNEADVRAYAKAALEWAGRIDIFFKESGMVSSRSR